MKELTRNTLMGLPVIYDTDLPEGEIHIHPFTMAMLEAKAPMIVTTKTPKTAFLAFLLLATPTPTAPKHRVLSVPPSVVTTLKDGPAYMIEEDGTILACDQPGYGMYVQPLGEKRIVFFYVLPGSTIHNSDKQRFVTACFLLVK